MRWERSLGVLDAACVGRLYQGLMTDSAPTAPRIAVLIPCRDEAATISAVVADFQHMLPGAVVYVYDNNSRDRTAERARDAGALVRSEPLQGKGNVVRRMFADVEADVYVLVDGDDTYDAAVAPEMVRRLLEDRLDMVNGARVTPVGRPFRKGHRAGNALLTGIAAQVFGDRVSDMLSGYRVFSRRFVKTFPALCTGFETETEFTIHALELRMPVAECATLYRERPEGSQSKLRTVSDGLRILRTMMVLMKEERPLQVFALAGLALFVLGIALGVPVVVEFLHTGLVPRLPTAVLATGLVLLSFLSLVCGLVLDSLARARKEMKRLAYLAIPAFGSER